MGDKGIAYQSLYSDERNEKLEFCLTCGRCKENCPVELDIPAIIRKIRSDGISSEIYYFLKAHVMWGYYHILLKSNAYKLMKN